MSTTFNLRVAGLHAITSPALMRVQVPAGEKALATTASARAELCRILRREDDRLLVVIGPCSIHDRAEGMEYARRLNELRLAYAEKLCIVMRVYFEKPRTTVGWKGLINDPDLDGSFQVEKGLRIARGILNDIAAMGLPAATEVLDPITPQYIADLVAWGAIGARTTESQTHRQMASGLSMPIGYKNGTDGGLQVALDAMLSAANPHHFLGIDDDGRCCVVQTTGNRDGHVILRGGSGKPNYHPEFVADAVRRLGAAKLEPSLMIDCSHANSEKKHENQVAVFRSILDQRAARTGGAQMVGATIPKPFITGTMVESNLNAGAQKVPECPAGTDVRTLLKPGVSITDACIGWDTTAEILKEAFERAV